METRPRAESTNKVASRVIINDIEDNQFNEDQNADDAATQISSGDLGPTAKTSQKPKIKCKRCRNKIRRKANIPNYVILPNDVPKQIWDYFVSLILIYVIIVIPYRVAFVDTADTPGWVWSQFAIDVIFFIDTVLTFFTAYQDENIEYVIDLKEIWK